MAISSTQFPADNLLPVEIWRKSLEDNFKPSPENEIVLARLARVCRLFRDIVVGLRSDSHKLAFSLAACKNSHTYGVWDSDSVDYWNLESTLFHRHAVFTYFSLFDETRVLKIVDFKSGQASYLTFASRPLVQGFDGETVYCWIKDNLKALNLSTLSESTLLAPVIDDEIFRHCPDGRLIRVNVNFAIPFTIFEKGQVAAQIPHTLDVSHCRLIDAQIENNLLCAIYRKAGGAAFFCLYNINDSTVVAKKNIDFLFPIDSQENPINANKITVVHSDRYDLGGDFYFSNDCIAFVKYYDLTINRIEITVFLIEQNENVFICHEASLYLRHNPGAYSFCISDRRFIFSDYERKKISVYEIRKNADLNKIDVITINEIDNIDLTYNNSQESLVTLHGDFFAIATGKKINLYSIYRNSQPIAYFETEAEIEEIQFLLEPEFPQLTVRLKGDRVQVWAPMANVSETTLKVAMFYLLKATYNWIIFIRNGVLKLVKEFVIHELLPFLLIPVALTITISCYIYDCIYPYSRR